MRFVVVGGGIAGLAAALRLRERAGRQAEIVVVEQASRHGGKLHTVALDGALGGVHNGVVHNGVVVDRVVDGGVVDGGVVDGGVLVEAGADSFLMWEGGQPSAALRLAGRVGLGDELVHPAPVPAAIALPSGLRDIPAGTLLGVPADLSTLDGLIEVVDADRDDGRPLLEAGRDVAVGELVRARLGDEVVRWLVEPVLGGVYAGRADRLSLAATMPGLHTAATVHSSLTAAVRAALAGAARPAGAPVFASVPGGVSRYAGAVARASAAEIRLGSPAREFARCGAGWRLTIGSTRDPAVLEADAVVLAIPARPAARLLAGVAPGPAAEVGALDYASVALVTLGLPAGTALPHLSGLLVPPAAGYAIKAATFVSTKWPQRRDKSVVLRLSLGRHGEEAVLQRGDDELAALAHRELGAVLGAALPAPIARAVSRWGGALPQYGVDHVARVARARAGLPAGLALAGAAVDGVGIAACVRSGEAAAEAAWRYVAAGEWQHG